MISPELTTTTNYQNLPNELQYADDSDFNTKDEQKNNTLDNTFSDILLKDNLKSNTWKTEHTQIERGNNDNKLWRNVRQLGLLLGDKEDINGRKQLYIIGITSMKHRLKKSTWMNNFALNYIKNS